MKHFKIHLLFNNSSPPKKKIQELWPVPKKIQILEIQNPQNTPLILVFKYAKSTPWGESMDKGRVDHGSQTYGVNGNSG